MTFLKKYDFQASMNYRAPQETPQGRDLSMYSIDLGLSTAVLKGKGTLTFNVRDLLNTRKRRTIIDKEDNYYSSSEFQWSARQLMLTFNYRLNQNKESNNKNGGGESGEMGGDGE